MKTVVIFTLIAATAAVGTEPNNIAQPAQALSSAANAIGAKVDSDDRTLKPQTFGTYNPGSNPQIWTNAYPEEHTTITATDNGNQVITGSTQLYTTYTAVRSQYSHTWTDPISAGGDGGGIMTANGSPPSTAPPDPLETGTMTA